jgi:hypothetical protein
VSTNKWKDIPHSQIIRVNTESATQNSTDSKYLYHNVYDVIHRNKKTILTQVRKPYLTEEQMWSQCTAWLQRILQSL